MRVLLTGVSTLALGTALALPVYAEEPAATDHDARTAATATPETAPEDAELGERQLGIDAPAVITDPAADARDDQLVADGTATAAGPDQLHDILSDIGAEEISTFVGALARARDEDGRTLVMFVGPEDLAAEDAGDFTFEHYAEVQERLEASGLEDVRQVSTWDVMKGRLDGHALFAVGVRDLGTIRAEMAIADPSDADDTRGVTLTELEGEAEEIDLVLLRGEAAGGYTIFLVIGPDGFEADAELDAEPEDLSERLEQAGLTGAHLLRESMQAARVELDDHSVLAFAAAPLAEEDEAEREAAAEDDEGDGADEQ
jgi:hypothetical protein